MDWELAFKVANASVVPCWAALIVAPRSRAASWVHSGAPFALIAVAYLIVGFTAQGAEGASFWTLSGVMQLFTMPHAVLAGWLHYLAFDLFVGAWEARDAQRLGLPRAVVAPCLLLTLMLGPLGLLLYVAVRGALRRRFSLNELPAG